jgi:hypothetical protein
VCNNFYANLLERPKSVAGGPGGGLSLSKAKAQKRPTRLRVPRPPRGAAVASQTSEHPMTIDRPMFRPRAESVLAFPAQPTADHRPEEAPSGDSPRPAEVIELRPSSRRPPRQPQGAIVPGCHPVSNRDQRERESKITKQAVMFTAWCSAYDGAWVAEHTGDGLFAGCDGIVGEKLWDGAEGALASLTKLLQKSDNTTIMTVELWSAARCELHPQA